MGISRRFPFRFWRGIFFGFCDATLVEKQLLTKIFTASSGVLQCAVYRVKIIVYRRRNTYECEYEWFYKLILCLGSVEAPSYVICQFRGKCGVVEEIRLEGNSVIRRFHDESCIRVRIKLPFFFSYSCVGVSFLEGSKFASVNTGFKINHASFYAFERTM